MNNENNNERLTSKDFNRLSIETACKLGRAVSEAMDELKGDGDTATAMDNPLYRQLASISLGADLRMMRHDRKKLKYEKMTLAELQKALYQRLQTYYHYGYAKGRELPGIKWHEEPNCEFVIDLGECAVNMEHGIHDDEKTGKAIRLSLDSFLLESQDPDDEESQYFGDYYRFFYFSFEDPDGTDYIHEVVIEDDEWDSLQILRDTLASLDLITDMAMEDAKKKAHE